MPLKSGITPLSIPRPRAFSVTTPNSLKRKIAVIFPGPENILPSKKKANRPGKIGQGSQKPGMLSLLTEKYPKTINPLLDELESTIPGLQKLVSIGPFGRLGDTPNAQPAILFTSVCILRVLQKEFGVDVSRFSYFLGHSLGEFTALVAADIISLPVALQLVHKRGLAMEAAAKNAGKVGMFALEVAEGDLNTLVQRIQNFTTKGKNLTEAESLSVACINSSTQLVVSGHVTAVEKCMNWLRERDVQDPRPVQLNVAVPCHSEIMAPAAEVVRKLLDDIEFRPENINKVLSNVTARPYADEAEMKELLVAHCMEKVRWKDTIEWLERTKGVSLWLGIGPGRIHTILVGKQLKLGTKSVLPVDGKDRSALPYAARVLAGVK